MRSVHRFASERQKYFPLFCFWTTCSCQRYKPSIGDKKRMKQFSLHGCRAAKCFVLLSAVHTYLGLQVCVKWPTFLSDFSKTWSFYTDFRRSPQYHISQKSDGWEARWYMQSDRQTDVMELNVAFLLFVGMRQITRAGYREWSFKHTFKHLWCLFMAYFHCYLNKP